MLQTLSIKQFAIIDELDINFSDGLTVMSGETGSGKSIIIDAIGQLIGMRASSDYVRHGEKKAIIEGIFDIDESKDAINILESLAIDVDEDFLLVKREIFSSGKSICRINNQTVTLQDLRKVMQELLDIHGQHETQSLLKQKYHLQLLDDYADNQYSDLLNQYQLSYNQYKNKRKELEELESADQALLQRLDLMKFQLEELTEASLKEGEVDQLESDIKRIAVWPRDLTNILFRASIILESSPPEAILLRLLSGSPRFGLIKNSTNSIPSIVGSSNGLNEISRLASFICKFCISETIWSLNSLATRLRS